MRSSKIIEVTPEIIFEVRKLHNLEKPGRVDEAVDIIEKWVKQQNHFLKKDFDRYYLETCLISCKGSLERTKERMDRLCTLKTLLPEYFTDFNPVKDFPNRFEVCSSGLLPKLEPYYNRCFILRFLEGKINAETFKNYFKLLVVMAEYLRMHDYCEGFILVFDYTNINIMDLLTSVNLVEVRQILTLLMKGYGMRIKGMHAVLKPGTSTKLIEMLWSVLRTIISEKLIKRTHFHDSIESLYQHIPKELLPAEYGGKEKSIKQIYANMLAELSSPEHMEFMKEINKAKVEEKLRLSKDKFNEEYLGLPGSFRQMTVD